MMDPPAEAESDPGESSAFKHDPQKKTPISSQRMRPDPPRASATTRAGDGEEGNDAAVREDDDFVEVSKSLKSVEVCLGGHGVTNEHKNDDKKQQETPPTSPMRSGASTDRGQESPEAHAVSELIDVGLIDPSVFGGLVKNVQSGTATDSMKKKMEKMKSGASHSMRKMKAEASESIKQIKQDILESPVSGVKSPVKTAEMGEKREGLVASASTSTASAKPSALLSRRRKSEQESAHSFQEHTYRSPTYCTICDGLLVGLWSQGFQCDTCGMNVHRGEGSGDHDDCKAEAMLKPCEGRTHRSIQQEKAEKEAKIGDVMAQLRDLAKNPNFLKEVSDQMEKDVKTKAKDAIVAAGVEGERTKNLRRIKTKLVPFVQKMDALAANGEIYIHAILLGLQACIALLYTVISFTSFIIALAPWHGVSVTTFRLASVHDATVTATLHVLLVILASTKYRLASLFKRKANLIDRFLRDSFGIDAEMDIGISVAGASERAKDWSRRILISCCLSMAISVKFWHRSQPKTWESADLPPVANMAVPAMFLTLCAGFVALVSYYNAAPLLLDLEEFVDVQAEMIKEEIDIAREKLEDPIMAKGEDVPSMIEEKKQIIQDLVE